MSESLCQLKLKYLIFISNCLPQKFFRHYLVLLHNEDLFVNTILGFNAIFFLREHIPLYNFFCFNSQKRKRNLKPNQNFPQNVYTNSIVFLFVSVNNNCVSTSFSQPVKSRTAHRSLHGPPTIIVHQIKILSHFDGHRSLFATERVRHTALLCFFKLQTSQTQAQSMYICAEPSTSSCIHLASFPNTSVHTSFQTVRKVNTSKVFVLPVFNIATIAIVAKPVLSTYIAT